MKKICIKCNTENEQDFRFCKRCGAVLPIVEEKTDITAEVVSPGREQAVFEETLIDGIRPELISAYVGKNSNRILDSFYNMSIYKKRTSFCLPVLILGLFLGFFGISAWFFYRKMHKIGLLFLIIPLFLSALDIVANFEGIKTFLSEYSALLSPYAMVDAETLFSEASALINNFIENYNLVLGEIRTVVEFTVAPCIASIFALYFYKKDVVKKVNKISLENDSDLNLSFKLSLSGGTSVIRALIPLFVVITASMLLTVLSFVLFM